MAKVYIGIGSNIGDRQGFIRRALELMPYYGVHVEKVSKIIETPPYGYKEQPPFLNCVAEVVTFLPPLRLLKALQDIEHRLGRVRVIRWGPRTIDLDILFYDDLVVETSYLKIPHPDMENRLFVLKPLAEIAPELKHPIHGKTVCYMLSDLTEHLQHKNLS